MLRSETERFVESICLETRSAGARVTARLRPGPESRTVPARGRTTLIAKVTAAASRCTSCGEVAAGPCARCRKPVCGGCCVDDRRRGTMGDLSRVRSQPRTVAQRGWGSLCSSFVARRRSARWRSSPAPKARSTPRAVKLFLTPRTTAACTSWPGADDPLEADADRAHAHVSAVLPLLAQNFDYVIVDTPAGLDERTLAAIECATDLLLVSSLDVTSIRSLRKALDALDQHRRQRATGSSCSTGPTPRLGLEPSDAEEGRSACRSRASIPSSRGDPAVAQPRHPGRHQRTAGRRWPSSCSNWPSVHARSRTTRRRKGWRRVGLTERIDAAPSRPPSQRGEVAGAMAASRRTRPATVDGLGDFKAKVHDVLFERLGTRLTSRRPTRSSCSRWSWPRSRALDGRYRDGAVAGRSASASCRTSPAT